MSGRARAPSRLTQEERLQPPTVRTLPEYVSVISSLVHDDRWLFRGQANANWALIPSISRIRPMADTVRRAEQQMMAEFKRYAIAHLERVPISEWEWLALAQHHGIPTRLLDWTTNPLAAMLFAVSGVSGADSTVWCFRHRRIQKIEAQDPYGITEVVVFRPSHFSGRVTGQASHFTVHPLPSRPFDSHDESGEELRKLIIPLASRPGLRLELDRVGVNYATLFPDLDGIARHVTWAHTVLADEEG